MLRVDVTSAGKADENYSTSRNEQREGGVREALSANASAFIHSKHKPVGVFQENVPQINTRFPHTRKAIRCPVCRRPDRQTDTSDPSMGVTRNIYILKYLYQERDEDCGSPRLAFPCATQLPKSRSKQSVTS